MNNKTEMKKYIFILIFTFKTFFVLTQTTKPLQTKFQLEPITGIKQLDIDKGFLGIQLESPFVKFNNYELAKVYENDDGGKEYVYDYSKIPSFKSFIVNGGNFTFTLGKLSSFSMLFSKTPVGSFDTLENYFTLKYGTPTLIINQFTRMDEQKNYAKEEVWETEDYKLNVIKLKGERQSFTEKEYFRGEIEIISKKLVSEKKKKDEEKKNNVEKEFQTRVGKGNSTFNVTIPFLEILLKSGVTKKKFESILPDFILVDSAVTFSHNPETDEWDTPSSTIYSYMVTYKKEQFSINLELYASKKYQSIKINIDSHPNWLNTKQEIAQGAYFTSYNLTHIFQIPTFKTKRDDHFILKFNEYPNSTRIEISYGK